MYTKSAEKNENLNKRSACYVFRDCYTLVQIQNVSVLTPEPTQCGTTFVVDTFSPVPCSSARFAVMLRNSKKGHEVDKKRKNNFIVL